MLKALIFDYGGTIDTDSVHWSHVIWDAYQAHHIPISYEHFRLAYIHGERTLAKFPLIQPTHNMLDLLRIKANVQTSFLVDAHFWADMDKKETERKAAAEAIAQQCYQQVQSHIATARPILQELSTQFSLALVSNFYGNIHTILHDFQLDTLFPIVVESAVVGIRKPNPQIFQLAIDQLRLRPEETAVIGDSYDKDILPAHSLHCSTVWIDGKGWDKQPAVTIHPTVTIHSFSQLPEAIRTCQTKLQKEQKG